MSNTLEFIFTATMFIISVLALMQIYDRVSGWFNYRKWEKEYNKKTPVPDDIQPVRVQQSASTGYDTEAFKDRMEKFKQEYYDGVPMYDVPVYEPKKGDEFTGVEVITPEYEEFMERKMKV